MPPSSIGISTDLPVRLSVMVNVSAMATGLLVVSGGGGSGRASVDRVAVAVGGAEVEPELQVQPVGRLAGRARRQIDGLGAELGRQFDGVGVQGRAHALAAGGVVGDD